MAAKQTTYILLFRGVGGATQLPTKPLREALLARGFSGVGTYINSGNAYLSTALPRAELARQIADLCAAQFDFTKDIHVVSLSGWRKLVANNPFPDAVEVPKFLHAAVLAGKPTNEALAALRAHAVPGERVEVVDQVAYLHTPHGFGRSKFAAKFDKGLGVANTARNWNTVLKLLELAEASR